MWKVDHFPAKGTPPTLPEHDDDDDGGDENNRNQRIFE